MGYSSNENMYFKMILELLKRTYVLTNYNDS